MESGKPIREGVVCAVRISSMASENEILSQKAPVWARFGFDSSLLESGCTGVYRSDSLDTLMQEECAHFRVDAIRRRKRGPFLSF